MSECGLSDLPFWVGFIYSFLCILSGVVIANVWRRR
jgi:hypothetical protein